MEGQRRKRIEKELKDITEDSSPKYFSAGKEKKYEWEATIYGSPDNLYEGGDPFEDED
ncbi:unnamed protein product [Dovyalis caffra]|uniref:Uncharacterized protein n=1 Tax=Dovyalis caffra TaxID=77055 RepID=A0AAV1S2F4_9ROSI|nr:unnamed protein product [Dovyalis caffra]